MLFLVVLLVAASSVCAQSWQRSRIKTFSTQSDTLQIDSVSIVPGSFRILSQSSNDWKFDLDEWSATLIWKSKKRPADSIRIAYQVYSFNFGKTYQKRKYIVDNPDERGMFNPFVINTSNDRENLFKFDGLTRNGSISRGVAFGNNQDLAVNSALNLQLAGKLAQDIEVNAAITDDNIPIQPAGNTQQLQDFDRVFIQLKQKEQELIIQVQKRIAPFDKPH
jgi:hypothetical protein